MTKLTKNQQELVDYAETHEGLSVTVEEKLSGDLTYTTVSVVVDKEHYLDFHESITISAMTWGTKRASQFVTRGTIGMTFTDFKKIPLKWVRSEVREMWLSETKAGRELREQYSRKIQEAFAG